MIALVKNLWNDESGQGLTEYALILGLISVVAIAILVAFGEEIARVFNQAGDEMSTAGVAPIAPTF